MELDPSIRVPVQLERLLMQSLPSEYVFQYKAYFLKLLSIKITIASKDEASIVKKIIKRADTHSRKRVSDLCARFFKLRNHMPKKEILYFLYRTRETSFNPISALEIPKPLPKPSKGYVSLPFTSKPVLTKLEKELIQDLLSVFQGADGKYLKYSELEEKYVITSSYALTSLVKMLEEITEIGYLYKKIIKFIESEHICLASECFSNYLKNELVEYYRLISLFQRDKEISIRKIYLWLIQPRERMKWLSVFCDAIETLRGNEIISAFFSYTCLGTQEIRDLTYNILGKISDPLMYMIEKWVTEGEINDPFHEFFISNSLIASPEDLWTEKFAVIAENVPCFFSTSIVDQIFLVGKTINFLKISCKKEWISEIKTPKPLIYEFKKLQTWVDEIANQTNQELFKVLFDEFLIKSHLVNLKKILLLGQGDFHHSLMEQLIEVLKDKAKKLHKHNLRSILENAIRASNLQYQDQEFLNLLDIKLFDPSLMDQGWDIFSLEYSVKSPLTVIFTSHVMETYAKIFKFLWRNKRAQFMLNEFQCIRTLIFFRNDSKIYGVIQKMMILRHNLRHFINNFMTYLMVEVIEVSWQGFYKIFQEAKNLDQLISAHNSYLDTLQVKMMLKNKERYTKIMKILDLCVKSSEIQKGLSEIVIEYSQNGNNLGFLKVFKEFEEDIEEIMMKFDEELSSLIEILIESNDYQQKILAFRLDFNEFYNLKYSLKKSIESPSDFLKLNNLQ